MDNNNNALRCATNGARDTFLKYNDIRWIEKFFLFIDLTDAKQRSFQQIHYACTKYDLLWEEALQQVLTLDNKIGISVGKYTNNCN